MFYEREDVRNPDSDRIAARWAEINADGTLGLMARWAYVAEIARTGKLPPRTWRPPQQRDATAPDPRPEQQAG